MQSPRDCWPPQNPEAWRRGLHGPASAHSTTSAASTKGATGLEGLAAVPVGGGGAWPGFETTRRAKLAARTAHGRAAAHGHTKQPSPTALGTPAEQDAT